MRRSLSMLLVAPGLLLSLARPAGAESGKKSEAKSRERAAALFEEAKARYNIHEYEEALAGFKEAYLLVREPVLILNMGQCYRFLGQKEEAITTFRTYLREDPETPYREEIARILTSLEEERAREEAPESQPQTTPSSAAAAEEGPPSDPLERVAKREEAPPRLFYGMTAAAFTLGVGSGGLAVALTQAKSLGDNGVGADQTSALLAESSHRFALGAGALVGVGLLSGGALYLLRRQEKKTEAAAPFSALLEQGL